MTTVNVLEVLDREVARAGGDAFPAGRELKEVREAVAELVATQAETLKMLEAAYRMLGMWSGDNKRVIRAREALQRIGGEP